VQWTLEAFGLVRAVCLAIVGPRGLEPRTSSLSGMRSNRAELWAPTGSQGTEIVSTSSPEAKLRSRMRSGPVMSSQSDPTHHPRESHSIRLLESIDLPVILKQLQGSRR
jgi:hypothetical protein